MVFCRLNPHSTLVNRVFKMSDEQARKHADAILRFQAVERDFQDALADILSPFGVQPAQISIRAQSLPTPWCHVPYLDIHIRSSSLTCAQLFQIGQTLIGMEAAMGFQTSANQNGGTISLMTPSSGESPAAIAEAYVVKDDTARSAARDVAQKYAFNL